MAEGVFSEGKASRGDHVGNLVQNKRTEAMTGY